MEKKFLLLLVIAAMIMSSESWKWKRSFKKIGKFVKKGIKVAKVAMPYIRKAWPLIKVVAGDETVDQHTLETLRKLREQEPAMYQAAMMIAEEELAQTMSKDEVDERLEALDYLLSNDFETQHVQDESEMQEENELRDVLELLVNDELDQRRLD